MKHLIISLLILLLTASRVTAQVAINFDGSSADVTSMLDIKSTDKGLLIPRMTTNQRTTIYAPPNSLLVYDTDTKSFWYYDTSSSAWVEIVNSSGNSINALSDGKAGSGNLFLGQDAGFYDNLGNNNNNVAVGAYASFSNISGTNNTAVGRSALFHNKASFNSAFGTGALKNDTSGHGNCAFGADALGINHNGNYNSAFGESALSKSEGESNTAFGSFAASQVSTGNKNVAIGDAALFKNITGSYNVAMGNSALFEDTAGYSNVAIGIKALHNNNNRNNLVAIGDSALYNNSTGTTNPIDGIRNVAVGSKAMYQNTLGSQNTAMGFEALKSNTSSNYNTAVGCFALMDNTTGEQNTGVGDHALTLNSTGVQNTAMGDRVMTENITGNYNVAMGATALANDSSGSYNTIMGAYSFYNSPAGNANTGVGYATGILNQGDSSVFLGYNAGYNETGSQKLYIENSPSATPLIWGDFANDSVKIYGTLGIKDQYAFPITDGTASQVLKTDGNGSLSWSNDSGATSINDLSDAKTTGNSVYLGVAAGSNDDGNNHQNTAVGDNAMFRDSIGVQNVALGKSALTNNVSGKSNVAIGSYSLYNNIGSNQVAVGNSALKANSSGNNNTVLGHWTGYLNTSGSGNVFIGYQAGYQETGSNKLYISNSSTTSPLIYGEFDNNLLTINGWLGVGTTASTNTKLEVLHDGLYAGSFKTDYGNTNTVALSAEYTGSGVVDATAIYGKSAPDANSNYGFGGDFIGNYMGVRAITDAGTSSGTTYAVYARSKGSAGTRYGVLGWAEGGSTRYGVYGRATAQSDSYGVYCEGNGVYTGTWSQTSDRKLKKNIKPLQGALEKLLQLSPKTYEYRTSEFSYMNLVHGKQMGFVAQDVETVFPELVSKIKHPKSQGKTTEFEEYKAINYTGLIPVLAGAIQEQQQQIKQQQQMIDELKNEIELLKTKN